MEFIKAYGGKCVYCGVSIDLISVSQFEVDHYIPHTDRKRFMTKKEAGYMDNLVLACHDCNHSKHEFSISDQYLEKLHPDRAGITQCFYRNGEYYIKMNPKVEDDQEISSFYKKIGFGREFHRLDYLLMKMIGLQKKYKDDIRIRDTLASAIEQLRRKRNIGVR